MLSHSSLGTLFMTHYRGPGGHPFFIDFLQRLTYYAYGPQLALRLRAVETSGCFLGYERCVECGFLSTGICSCFHLPAAAETVPKGDEILLFAHLGRYLIALRFPQRAQCLREMAGSVDMRGREMVHCHGCDTFAKKYGSNQESCQLCRKIIRCGQAWCKQAGGIRRCTMCQMQCCYNCVGQCEACGGSSTCHKCQQTFACQSCEHSGQRCVWHTQQRLPWADPRYRTVELMCEEHFAAQQKTVTSSGIKRVKRV